MENEIKIIPSSRTQLKLRAAFRRSGQDAVVDEIRNTIGLTGAEIVAVGVENIIDEYWDTPKLALYQSGRCFRLRTTEKGTTIYVKDRGKREDGIFRREEIPYPLSGEEAIRAQYAGFREVRGKLLIDYADAAFCETLLVSNQRRVFLLSRRGEEYELAIDFFHYSSPHFLRTSTVQSEIEIEAMNSEANQKIGELGQIIRKCMKGARSSKQSKYERGVSKLRLQYPLWMLRLFESVDTLSIKWILALATIVGLILAALPFLI